MSCKAVRAGDGTHASTLLFGYLYWYVVRSIGFTTAREREIKAHSLRDSNTWQLVLAARLSHKHEYEDGTARRGLRLSWTYSHSCRPTLHRRFFYNIQNYLMFYKEATLPSHVKKTMITQFLSISPSFWKPRLRWRDFWRDSFSLVLGFGKVHIFGSTLFDYAILSEYRSSSLQSPYWQCSTIVLLTLNV